MTSTSTSMSVTPNPLVHRAEPAPQPKEAPDSLATRIKQAIYPLMSRLVTRATLVEGQLKQSGETVRVLFVHNCLFNREIETRSLDNVTVLQRSRMAIPGIAATLRAQQGQVDLISAVLPASCAASMAALKPFQGHQEVRQIIDTSCGWEQMRKDFSKKRRQITNEFREKHGLDCRVSHDPADFDMFYHRMFVPHIQRRYGELADIDSHAELKQFFDRGMLFLVMSEGKEVAGALSELVDGHLLFRRSGVLDGDESHVKGGAQTALYYFQLQHAVANGIWALDTLKTTPFLNDGVFKHKADWGARSFRDDEATHLTFLVPGRDPAKLARFFEISPIVIDDGNKLSAIVGDTTIDAPAPGYFDKLLGRISTSGLSSVQLQTRTGLHHFEIAPPATTAPAAARPT